MAVKLFDTIMRRARKILRNLPHKIEPRPSMAQSEILGTLIVIQILCTMPFISKIRP